jgi:hypothetical protein
VLDEFQIATRSLAPIERTAAASARDSEMHGWVKQFFHPYVLAFLALALSVGGSGYGYKLSQYFQHSGVTKASPTRMWVEHRDESVAIHYFFAYSLPGSSHTRSFSGVVGSSSLCLC